MCKQAAALLLALLLALTGVSAAAAGIGGTQEQVTYTQTNAWGDPAVAQGLTVCARYGYQNRALWFTDHTHGAQNTVETEFRFYTMQPDFYESTLQHSGVIMEVAGDPGDQEWERLLAENAEHTELPGLLGAYRTLYEQTKAGGFTDTYVRYADYCDYYPLYGYLDLPGFLMEWSCYSTDGRMIDGGEASRLFNDYFKIPVLEDDWVQMLVDKRENSGMASDSIDISYPRKGTDYYEMETVGVCVGNTAYFTFDAHTAYENLVDTSLIPGGYGLYALTIREDGTPDYDSLTTLRSLDITHHPRQMIIDEENGHLLYFTTKDLDSYLTVIDLQSLDTLQQLCIQEYDPDNWQWHRIEEDWILCVTEDASITVYQMDDRGLFDHCFTAPLEETDERYANSDLYESAFSFNGRYLAVVGKLWTAAREEGRHWLSDEICGYELSVYSGSGLEYYAQFVSSLEPPIKQEGDQYQCGVYQLSAVWQETAQ